MAFTLSKRGRDFSFPSVDLALVSFGLLSPLADSSPWSIIALVRPTSVSEYGGIIARRAGFDIGSHQFSCLLKQGHLAIGADNKEHKSALTPPINQWSMVCAAASANNMHLLLGLSDGQVQEESHSRGIPTGTTTTETILRVGHLGGSFPGILGLICLYSECLTREELCATCHGETSPFSLPSLVFAWEPGAATDIDQVSKRVAVVSGTRSWPQSPAADADLLKPLPFSIEDPEAFTPRT